ncbi:MAG: ABC transporter ATP-binding protein [Coriobacteriia bacterium]|nr:ABC transporter ATP-binding protein [Coriobacteriia bacterium]
MPEPSSVFRLRRRDLAKVVTLAVLQAATLGASLVLLRHLIDELTSGLVDQGLVYRDMAVLLGAVLLNSLLRGAEFTVSEKMGYELIRGLRMTMYRHLQGMSVRQLQARSRGGLLLRFTGDLSMLRTWVSRGLARGLVSLVILTGGIGVIAYLNVRLAFTMAAVLAFGSAALTQLGPRLHRITRTVRRKRSLITSNIDEQLHALAVTQVFGRSGGEFSRLSRQNDSVTRSLHDTARTRGWMLGISSATGWLAIFCVLLVGTIDVASGNSSVGVVVAAMIACRQLAGPVRRLGLSYDYWQRAEVSRVKLLDFLSSSTRPLDAAGLEGLRVRRGRIELRGVSVYGSLREVDATAQGGHVTALLGPNGAGKSTLLNVVAGLLDPDGGEILVDDQPLSARTLRSRFRGVGMVSPDLPLMCGTVRRNLTYREPEASEEELRRVTMSCGLDEVLAELPYGLGTWLTPGGSNLSLGQRQRLALGRALLGNPPILLLDEPTVNLDDASKEVFRDVIAHHKGTVLLATHETAEAALADEVWFMDGGSIVEAIDGDEFRDRLWAMGPGGARRSRCVPGVDVSQVPG